MRTRGESESALSDFSEAEQLFEALGARPYLAPPLQEHAKALSSAGRAREARKLSKRAKALLREMGISEDLGRSHQVSNEALAEAH
jgi:protein-tyrosine-phosphatase